MGISCFHKDKKQEINRPINGLRVVSSGIVKKNGKTIFIEVAWMSDLYKIKKIGKKWFFGELNLPDEKMTLEITAIYY